MRHLILVAYLLPLCISAQGQDLRANSVNIFLDCHCDQQFIKQEIPYVNYVRDRKEADIHLIVTRMSTGSGGDQFTLRFIGQREFLGVNDTLSFNQTAMATSDETRKEQLKYIKGGLFRYIVKSEIFDQISITHNIETNDEEIMEDRWNSWVFDAGVNGYVSGESSYNQGSVWGEISATKITPDWKLEFSTEYSLDKSNFDYESTVISTKRESYFGRALVVKSIDEHWSAGGRVNYASSIYQNYKNKISIQPAIEYNFFPYSEAVTKQFRIQYRIGPEIIEYKDSTIYNQLKQNLVQHSLLGSFRTKQKWGSISASVSYYNYLHDWSKNRTRFSTNFNIRIVKGLSVQLSMGASIIHDQLNLANGGASAEELLTRQKEIATSFNLFSSFGLNYTFGSIYNNVVNPRFGN